YGDGRLDPCEWVRTGDGRLLKTDAAGHDHDHTVVGPQPLAWDLAGALVEWEDRAAVQDGFTTSGGHVPARPLLDFYEAAYCAFRLGLAHMSAFAAGRDDSARLEVAGRRYATRLGALLAAVR
ncbi:MAG TPA: hypothetical protein VNT60_00405, partial [Deinococcales bacterium]|nr:hypothetical protein [Deinococcales bacterium]